MPRLRLTLPGRVSPPPFVLFRILHWLRPTLDRLVGGAIAQSVDRIVAVAKDTRSPMRWFIMTDMRREGNRKVGSTESWRADVRRDQANSGSYELPCVNINQKLHARWQQQQQREASSTATVPDGNELGARSFPPPGATTIDPLSQSSPQKCLPHPHLHP